MKKTLLILPPLPLWRSRPGPAMAQKKTLAVVVKGLDNGFFTVMGKGCAEWNESTPDSAVHVRLHRSGADL